MNEKYFDTLETRDPHDREQDLLAKLSGQIAHAKTNTQAYAELLGEVEPGDINSLQALAQLPVVRKSELLDRQRESRPFGGFAASNVELARVFGSPGPIYEPEPKADNYWRVARALYAAGFRSGQLIHNTFSYHLTPAGSIMESGAHAMGCSIIPAGVGQTELQVQTINDLEPVGYTGTPSFLKIILEKARDLGVDISSIQHGLVSGEALPGTLRNSIRDYGVSVLQAYVTADLGLIAYESEAQEGLILDEEIIVEIVRPGTGEVVEVGEVGEVVVTSFSKAYPLIRFGTGDLSAMMPGTSPCGRTNVRIKGWMGRADQATKVKGMFVHPSQVNEVVKRHPLIEKARLVVDNHDGQDLMTLHCEVKGDDPQLVTEIASSIKEVCKLRGEVKLVDPGSLVNDGKVIDDVRSYD